MKVDEILEMKAMLEAREGPTLLPAAVATNITCQESVEGSNIITWRRWRRSWFWMICLQHFGLIFLFLISASIAVYLFHYYESWTVNYSCYYLISLAFAIGSLKSPEEDVSCHLAFFFLIFLQLYMICFFLKSGYTTVVYQISQYKLMNNYDAESIEKLTPSRVPIVSWVIFLVLWMIFGALFLHFNENWTFIQSLYWCVMVTTTIGADSNEHMTLRHPSSRIFGIVYIVMNYIHLFIIAISVILSHLMRLYLRKRIHFLQQNPLSISDFPPRVDRVTFLQVMLEKKYGYSIDHWIKIFDEMDGHDGEGVLEVEDIRAFIEIENSLREVQLADCYSALLRNSRYSPFASAERKQQI